MKALALCVLVGLVLGVALGVWLGHKLGYADGMAVQAGALKTAQDDATDVRLQLSTTRAGLADLKGRLQRQIDEHAQLQQRAQLAAAKRETRIAELTQRAARLEEEIRHDKDSQKLADVPVPDAMARRLWPGAHAHDHTP